MSETDALDQSIKIQLNYKPEDRPKRSPTLAKLAGALAKAQGSMQNADKDGKGTYGKYATLASTWDAIRKPLSDNGIALIQRPATVNDKPHILTMLIHESGEFLDDAELELKFDTSGRINGMQAMGSAVTYARRYSAQAVTGIAPMDDDDGAGSGEPQKGQGKQQDKPKPESKPQASKPQDGPKDLKLDPINFIMPFGDAGIKGSKLSALSEKVLKNIDKHCDSELKLDPKPKNAAALLQISLNVKAMLKLWEERHRLQAQDTPANIDQATGEILPPALTDNVLPEDQTQNSPDYENQTQEVNGKGKPTAKDPADTVVGMDFDTVDGVNGKKLREIPEASLKLMVKELDKKMQQTPPPPNIGSLFGFKGEISAFLKSVGS